MTYPKSLWPFEILACAEVSTPPLLPEPKTVEPEMKPEPLSLAEARRQRRCRYCRGPVGPRWVDGVLDYPVINNIECAHGSCIPDPVEKIQ